MTFKHGYARVGNVERLHKIWRKMLERCDNPNCKEFKYYGGRGISIVPAWRNYVVFREWAHSNGYQENLTIERKDNDAEYSPENCRWATMKEQCRNRTTTAWVEYKGERKSIAAWAELYGLKFATLYKRLKGYGWGIEEALTTPVGG